MFSKCSLLEWKEEKDTFMLTWRLSFRLSFLLPSLFYSASPFPFLSMLGEHLLLCSPRFQMQMILLSDLESELYDIRVARLPIQMLFMLEKDVSSLKENFWLFISSFGEREKCTFRSCQTRSHMSSPKPARNKMKI